MGFLVPNLCQALSAHAVTLLHRILCLHYSTLLLSYRVCISLCYIARVKKYLVLHRITTCYSYLYKNIIVPYNNEKSKTKQTSHSHLVRRKNAVTVINTTLSLQVPRPCKFSSKPVVIISKSNTGFLGYRFPGLSIQSVHLTTLGLFCLYHTPTK